MDYYKEYEEYAIEIDNACSCVNSNKCSNLNREIETMATAVDGINLSSVWQDGVASAFASAIDTTKKCLNDISSSISSLFMESEEIYIKLQQQLLFLKNANIKYMNTRDNEKPDYDDFSVSAEYENGVLVKEGYFRQSDYDKAVADWRGKVQALEDECIALKTEIEKNKTRLSEINGETVMTGTGFTTLVVKYGNTLNVSTDSILELAAANGITLLTYSNWGEDFYVLADITGAGKQGDGECLAFSNAYVTRILEERANLGLGNTSDTDSEPIFYSSKDKQVILQIAAREIMEGRPVVFEVQGTKVGKMGTEIVPVIKNGEETTEEVFKCTRHFVAVYGIRKGADIDNLQESDFYILIQLEEK